MNFRTCFQLALVSAFSVVSAALPKPQPEWHVSSLNVRITINTDSPLLVDETQVIPENPDRDFGLRCEIPIGDNDPRRGARVQPAAQAMGRNRKMTNPEGAKDMKLQH